MMAADIVREQDGAAPVPAGRLWLGKGKARLEVTELPDGYFLIDGTPPAAIFVKPAARVYMDARRSSRLTQWFVPVDVSDPCRQWQAMAHLAGEADHGAWHCEAIKQGSGDDRGLLAFRAMAGSQQQFIGWVDPVLGIPVRIELGDGTAFAVVNIKDQPRPADFFQLRADFHRFDPQALIERIKQSDVWVDAH